MKRIFKRPTPLATSGSGSTHVSVLREVTSIDSEFLTEEEATITNVRPSSYGSHARNPSTVSLVKHIWTRKEFTDEQCLRNRRSRRSEDERGQEQSVFVTPSDIQKTVRKCLASSSTLTDISQEILRSDCWFVRCVKSIDSNKEEQEAYEGNFIAFRSREAPDQATKRHTTSASAKSEKLNGTDGDLLHHSGDDEINSASSSPLPRGKRNGMGRYWSTVSPSNSSLEDVKVSKEKAGTFEIGRGEDLDVTRLEGSFAATTGAQEPCLVGKQTTVEQQEPTPAKIRDLTLNGSDSSKTSYSLPCALGPNENMPRHRRAPWTDGDVAEGRQSMKQSNDDTLKITTTMTSTGRVIRAEGSYFPPIENIGMFHDSTLGSDEKVEFSQFGAEMESDRAASIDVFDGASYSYTPSTSSSGNGTFTSPDGPTQRSENVASSVQEESEKKINGHLATQSERLRKRIDSIKRSRRAMALARLHQQVPIESKDQELDLDLAYSGYPRHSPTVGAFGSQAFQYPSGNLKGSRTRKPTDVYSELTDKIVGLVKSEACADIAASAMSNFESHRRANGNRSRSWEAQFASLSPSTMLKKSFAASLTSADERRKHIGALCIHWSLSKEENRTACELVYTVWQRNPTLIASAWSHTLITSIAADCASSSSSAISLKRFATNLLARCQKELAHTLHWAGLADQPSAAHSFVTAGYGRLKVAIEVLVEIQRNCLDVAKMLKGWEGAAHLTCSATLDGAAPKLKEPKLAWLAVSLRTVDDDDEESDFIGEAKRAGWRLETSSTNDQGKSSNIKSNEKKIDTEEDSIDASVKDESDESHRFHRKAPPPITV
ncbi:hypothetical protein FA10DRAFT_290961 [Acaromyces ingoldii]|uniref:Uncharacterized protein n=1 Tax=Acaromyces ingoldii TaxID=215250 RepID=A0A316YX62_9BASI|nr:hypothetical protein FA10DRAFT_290961 [Acaromyces ingoldii]PWN93771.1 hypothetical protein FA10DRAFT_290961 [Acaromyces ingoldii]